MRAGLIFLFATFPFSNPIALFLCQWVNGRDETITLRGCDGYSSESSATSFRDGAIQTTAGREAD